MQTGTNNDIISNNQSIGDEVNAGQQDGNDNQRLGGTIHSSESQAGTIQENLGRNYDQSRTEGIQQRGSSEVRNQGNNRRIEPTPEQKENLKRETRGRFSCLPRIIYLQEVSIDGHNTTKEQSNAMQHLQEPYSKNDNLQGVSERDTLGNFDREIRPQSSSPTGQRDTLRSEGRQDSLLSTEGVKQKNEVTTPSDTTDNSEGGEGIGFREPDIKEIYRDPNFEDTLAKRDAKQRHITDIAKKLDSKMTLVWVEKGSDKLNGKNGKYVRETNTMYIAKDIPIAQMYVEVFKHEFIHRLESKGTYISFKKYLIEKSVAFENYVRGQLRIASQNIIKAYENGKSNFKSRAEAEQYANLLINAADNGNRGDAITQLANYYYDTFVNDESISKPIRDRFTKELAEREMVADFGGDVLFKGKENRKDIAQALSEGDIEAIGKIEDSMDALEELANTDRNLFQKIWDSIKEFIRKLSGSPQTKRLVEDLEYIEQRLARVYDSRDTKKAANNSGEVQYSWKNDSKGNKYWHIDTEQDIFKKLKTKHEFEKAAFDYIIGMRDKNIVVDAIDGKQMSFIRLSAEEFTNSEESKDLYANDPVMFAQKMRLIPSIKDLASNANVNWWSPDQKNHKLFKERGFENFRGRVGIDNVIFNFVIRSGKAKFGDVFYDINLEVDSILPHAKSASEISKSTSSDITVPQKAQTVNNNSMPNSENYSEEGQFSSGSPMQQARELLTKYEQGEISQDEYLAEMDDIYGQAVEGYGSIPEGENANAPITTPKAVADDRPTERFARTFIETGKLTEEMVEGFETKVLLGDFSYDIISDEQATKTAEKATEETQGRFSCPLCSKMSIRNRISIQN